MRLRLILSFALIVIVSIASMLVFARRGAANEVRAFMMHGTLVESDQLVAELEAYYQEHRTLEGAAEALNFPGLGQARGRGAMGMGTGGNQRIQLSDADGLILYDSSQGSPTGKLNRQEIQAAIPLQSGGQTIGFLSIQGSSGFSSTDQNQLVNRINQVALTAGLIAGGISLVLALVLAYRLLKPVQELTQAAEQLAQGDLSQRVDVRGNDELATLGKTFNQMASSLQSSEANRRAMTADIAHELRNPLAIQRANLEALQDGIYPPTPENLELVLEQNHLLTRLVDDLRTLALADAGQLELDRTPTDMKSLVERLLSRYVPQARERNIQIDLTSEEPYESYVQVVVDPIRIEQIIVNLFSNAIRHTHEGGFIHSHLSATLQAVQLVVHDSGPGFPEEALPHLFERFYRVDKSRSRSEGGTGLGLAIARQLAEAHGGSLIAANHPSGGAVFTLTIPK